MAKPVWGLSVGAHKGCMCNGDHQIHDALECSKGNEERVLVCECALACVRKRLNMDILYNVFHTMHNMPSVHPDIIRSCGVAVVRCVGVCVAFVLILGHGP